MANPRTDPARLRVQYADASNLNARVRLHQRFSVNPRGFAEWLFDHVAPREGAKVLEVGCGPVWLWRRNRERIPTSWEITVTDFSPGMVREARQRLPVCGVKASLCVCDAQALPFAEVRPGARWRDASDLAFALDDADSDLRLHFGAVERFDYEDELRVPEPGPLIDFIASSMEVSTSLCRDLEIAVRAEIADCGYYRIGKQVGLLVAALPLAGRRAVGERETLEGERSAGLS